MAITNGDHLRVAVEFLFENLHSMVNVWHIVVDDVGTNVDDSEVMDAITTLLDTWYTQYAGAVDPSITGNSVTGINVTKDELLPETPLIWAGTNAGELLPLMVAPTLNFNSAVPRHGARIYLMPPVESANNDGIIAAGTLTILLDMAADLLAGFVDAGSGLEFRRVTFERATNTIRDLETGFVPTTFRTQRRRRQGVGA